MSARLFRAWAALLLCPALASVAGAKPPDLPIDLSVTLGAEPAKGSSRPTSVEVRAGLDLSGRVEFDVTIKQESEGVCCALDVVSPCLYAAFAQLLEAALAAPPQAPAVRFGSVWVPCASGAPGVTGDEGREAIFEFWVSQFKDSDTGDDAEPPSSQQEQARRMYERGERCRRRGDLDMAYGCFRETIRICPASAYSAKAADEARAIEAQRAAEEASECPDEKPSETLTDDAELAELLRKADALRSQSPPCLETAPRAGARLAETPTPTARDLAEEQARRMYRKAGRSYRAGDLDRAYIRYQQTHLICPDSEYGRRAMERVFAIEQQLQGDAAGAAEEQEDRPGPGGKERKDRKTRKLLEDTEPLQPVLDPFISADVDQLKRR